MSLVVVHRHQKATPAKPPPPLLSRRMARRWLRPAVQDREALLDACGWDDDRARGVEVEFLTTAPSMLSTAATALLMVDCDSALRVASDLRHQCLAIGAAVMVETCGAVELACEEEDIERACRWLYQAHEALLDLAWVIADREELPAA